MSNHKKQETKPNWLFAPDARPHWWHGRGKTVYDAGNRRDRSIVTLTSKSCHLKIQRTGENEWIVSVYMHYPGKNRTTHERYFNAVELATAFDTPRDLSVGNGLYAFRRRANFGVEGLFIRRGNFLNIPCPGSGVDGDPNMSIRLTAHIREKIGRFLRTGIASA